nr:MAG TPA: hypothetical protein [Caudoviricetes sp.]
MNKVKEQLYDVFVICKDGGTYRNKEAISCTIVGLALVIESRYTHGIGKVIYGLNSVESCSCIPVGQEDKNG